jgi:hypothetical protein
VYCGSEVTEKARTQMEKDLEKWTKELEVELATLASDMWATQTRLEQKGFGVDSGNKTPRGG